MTKRIIVLIMFFGISYIQAQELNYYYPNSTVIKESGKVDAGGFPKGIWKYFSENGTLDYEINWGTNYIKKYYTTGELKETGTFIPETGVYIGKWITYNKNGQVKSKKIFNSTGKEINLLFNK